MSKARTLNLQAVLVLIAGLLAAAAVWAGLALAGGGSGGSGVKSNPTPARGDAGLVQDSNRDHQGGRDCPFKDGRGDSTGFDTSTL